MQDFTNEFSFVLKPTEWGMGVFTTHAIRSGTHLRLFGDEEGGLADNTRLMNKDDVPGIFHGYCLDRENGMMVCPPDFGVMAIGWYLDHAATPNAVHKKDFKWYASEDIGKGVEITIDYNRLEEPKVAHEAYYAA
ncbi:MAG: SET domain-containing protein [Patescibacteria group bacterium]|mgnify:CR=1 FL=1